MPSLLFVPLMGQPKHQQAQNLQKAHIWGEWHDVTPLSGIKTENSVFRRWHENYLRHTTESEKQTQGRRNIHSMTGTAHNTFWSLFLTVDFHKLLLFSKSVRVDTDWLWAFIWISLFLKKQIYMLLLNRLKNSCAHWEVQWNWWSNLSVFEAGNVLHEEEA